MGHVRTYQGQVAGKLGTVPTSTLSIALAGLNRDGHGGLGALPLAVGQTVVGALASLCSAESSAAVGDGAHPIDSAHRCMYQKHHCGWEIVQGSKAHYRIMLQLVISVRHSHSRCIRCRGAVRWQQPSIQSGLQQRSGSCAESWWLFERAVAQQEGVWVTVSQQVYAAVEEYTRLKQG
jgi:hypothetical protein